MKIIASILLFFSTTTYGQLMPIDGKVIDSLSKKPIALGLITLDKNSAAISADFKGNFKLISASENLNITAKSLGYKTKTINITDFNKQVIIELVADPFDIDAELRIVGKPIDSVFYSNGKIKTINFQYGDQITFFKNGKLESKKAGESIRSWYDNGKLKYQSIAYSSHLRSITEWYENGNVKSHGKKYWRFNKKTNEGEWLNSDDWKFWNTQGKEIKK